MNLGFGEEPSVLARRLIAGYVLIMLTLVVVLQGVAAIRTAADNRSDIQRNAVQTELLRAAQFDNCERSKILAEGLREATQTIMADPDTSGQSKVDLQRAEKVLNREPCTTVLALDEQ